MSIFEARLVGIAIGIALGLLTIKYAVKPLIAWLDTYSPLATKRARKP